MPTPNDPRSNAKNPTSPENKAARDNRANQINPNNQATKGKK
ncbi:MAG: hypothetical protein QOD77_1199 [Thermoplasmata archaeon]|jgi:hypothetical protein|nr:hypothetical protein [Thermoplasmata archaeon]